MFILNGKSKKKYLFSFKKTTPKSNNFSLRDNENLSFTVYIFKAVFLAGMVTQCLSDSFYEIKILLSYQCARRSRGQEKGVLLNSRRRFGLSDPIDSSSINAELIMSIKCSGSGRSRANAISRHLVAKQRATSSR